MRGGQLRRSGHANAVRVEGKPRVVTGSGERDAKRAAKDDAGKESSHGRGCTCWIKRF